MSTGIKWTKSQRQRLSSAVKQFNKRVKQEARRHPDKIPYLPDKLEVNKLKKSITTPGELRSLENSVMRLYKDNALDLVESQKGIITTKFQLQQVKLNIKKINKMRQEERSHVPEDASYRGVLGSVKRNSLRDKKFNFNMIDPSNWDKYIEAVERQSYSRYNEERLQMYKQNYLSALVNEYGNTAKDIGLYDLIKNMDLSMLKYSYYENSLLDIKAIYWIENPIELLISIYDEWGRYLKDKGENFADLIHVNGGWINPVNRMFIADADNEDDIEFSRVRKTKNGYVNIETGELYEEEE